jgi:hypothetical protein
LGRFAYGPGGGSAGITLSANPLGSAPNPQLAWFSDATWRTAKGALNCQSTPAGSLSVLQNTISSVTETATMPAANTLWVFALQSLPSSTDPAGTPCPPLAADYTLTATQASGSQLSYEEQGLPAIYACFWVFMALTAGAHVYGHIIAPLPQGYPTGDKGMRPPLVTCLLAALTLHMASDTLHLIEWAYVDVTGAESGLFLAVAGGLLRLAELAAIWVMAAFIATGAYCAHRGAQGVKDRQAARDARTAEIAASGRETAAIERLNDTTSTQARLTERNADAQATPDSTPSPRDVRRGCRQLREAGIVVPECG